MPAKPAGYCCAAPLASARPRWLCALRTRRRSTSPTVNCSFECGNHGRPLPPSVALGSLLAGLGFRGTAIPETLADRANLYRSAMADRVILVLADDVLDEDQARHLLPGTPSSALLLTSRSRLPGVEALSRLALTPLSPTDAHAVLTGILGPQKTTAEPVATTQLISHCAGLPLALRIAAARLASQPLSLHHLERLLADVSRVRLCGWAVRSVLKESPTHG